MTVESVSTNEFIEKMLKDEELFNECMKFVITLPDDQFADYTDKIHSMSRNDTNNGLHRKLWTKLIDFDANEDFIFRIAKLHAKRWDDDLDKNTK